MNIEIVIHQNVDLTKSEVNIISKYLEACKRPRFADGNDGTFIFDAEGMTVIDENTESKIDNDKLH